MGTHPYGNPRTPRRGKASTSDTSVRTTSDSAGLASSALVALASSIAVGSVSSNAGATGCRQRNRASSHLSSQPCSNKRKTISSQIGATIITTTAVSTNKPMSGGADCIILMSGCPDDSEFGNNQYIINVCTVKTGASAARQATNPRVASRRASFTLLGNPKSRQLACDNNVIANKNEP